MNNPPAPRANKIELFVTGAVNRRGQDVRS